MILERATSDDVPAILALANWAAVNTPANFATEPEPLADWAASFAQSHEKYPWIVARDENRLLGFAKASMHRARGAYRWTAEVSVYVDPDAHRRGIGRALYGALIPCLRAQGYVTLLAGITPPNPASERLHESMGFVRCGTYHRAGWKFDRWHDVGYWDMHLQPVYHPPEPIRPVADVWPKLQRLRVERTGLSVRRADLTSDEAATLIRALNHELASMYSEPGANHFHLDPAQVTGARGAYVIAYVEDEPAGCGAVRAFDDGTAELKRMFVVPRWRALGISRHILHTLEEHAAGIGVKRMLLETGTRQKEALSLYERAGYSRIPLFGEYIHSPLTSVCMAKTL
ncbi:GNAT family N-acetyltransferase [Pendulispora rubella]|uniref:GNAT family N-acetyltransferase n=1 Tax=Pendulispora rubella TaxID=2741070 RepID=A0ABZ2L2L1_9BACT